MPRTKLATIALYDEYARRPMDRRRFLGRFAKIAGAAAVVSAMPPLPGYNAAGAAVVAADDARLKMNTVTFASAAARMSGYLARPAKAAGALPGLVVIHENRGLNGYIRDVARRAALEGFVVLAPDFLAPAGGTPDDRDAARAMINELDDAATLVNALAAVAYIDDHPAANGRTGAIGFSWGGTLVNKVAVRSDRLESGVVFYGLAPDSADAPRISARMLLHYAGFDSRINRGAPGYKQALDAAGIDYATYTYDNVNHDFHDDTNAARYNREAAELAWSRTVAFLKQSLGD